MKKAISLIMIASMLLFVLALLSCNGNKSDDSVDGLSVIHKGEARYVLYRPFKGSEGESSSATLLRDLMREKTGVSIKYTTDHKVDKIEGFPELLIGNTTREASAQAAEGLGENQCRIIAIDSTICLVASNDFCLEACVKTFIDEYADKDGVIVPTDVNRTWSCVKDYDIIELQNPILDSGSDPYVTEHDGTYYYCWSAGTGVKVSSASSPYEITYDNSSQVYSAPSDTMWSGEYWAPELHYINGEWYIYVAADDGNNENHRMYVLKGSSQNPKDKFTMVGKITDPSDKWAIDGTVLQLGDELYFIWSGWGGSSGDQQLFIAHMSDPCTIDSARTQISYPNHSWESPLNEGPIVAYHGDDVFVLFSAAGSWTDGYCIGYLKLNDKSNPLKTGSWTKNDSPILKQGRGVYGPGHCSVVSAPDGSLWMIYHANLVAGTGWNGRSVWIQSLTFADNGNPIATNPSKTVKYPVEAWKTDTEIK